MTMPISLSDRVRLLAAKKSDSDAFRSVYDLAKEALIEAGWTPSDIEEMQIVLKVDLADGPGAKRSFPMTLQERRACWLNWLSEKAPHAGTHQRIRASLAQEKIKAA